jgi:NAD(P)-dependent dehydrogenase (short-subunit alcohol dehydrogenase family)
MAAMGGRHRRISEADQAGAGAARRVLVTGAGRGIGRGIARRFLQDGAAVCLADVDEEALADAADEYAVLGRLVTRRIDVARDASVSAGVEWTAAELGGLDVVVNNAGIADPVNGPVERLAEAHWRRVLDTNLTGPLLVVKHAVPHLRRAAGGGVIINIASSRAVQSEKDTEAYAASKGGLVALTHALAVSLGPEIRVHCVSPGWIDTSDYAPRAERRPARLRPIDHTQHPVGRVGRPEDIAGVCAWLASADAGFATGQNHVIDGGMTRKMIYAE